MVKYTMQNVCSRARHVSCSRLAVLAVTVAIIAPTNAVAQQYKSIQPQLERRAAKALSSKVNSGFRDAANFDPQVIDEYYKKYYFPRMTQNSTGALAVLGKSRESLIKRLRGTNVRVAQQHLTNLTLGVMRAVSRDNYHPSVRYNATLVIGMLDEQYPKGGANPTPPKVLAEATGELLELLEQDEFKDVKVHPSVKVGALEGLERHARFGIDPQYAERVTKAAMAVFEQDASKLGVDNDVNNWMKCQAAKVLARQYEEGPNNEVHSALTKLLADEKLNVVDRCCIAGIMERMKYGEGAIPNAKETLLPLGKLTKAVVADGAERAREFQEEILKNPGIGRRNSGGLGRRGGPQGPQLERRELLTCLVQIDAGAKALTAGIAGQEKQELQKLRDLLAPVIDKSKDSDALDLEVTGEVIKLESSLDTLIASWQPAAPARADGEVDFE